MTMTNMRVYKTSLLIVLGCCFATWGSAKTERIYGTAPRDDAAAAAAFQSIVPVLQHPRCMNCHSTGDFPRQGDDGHPHTMNIRRGLEGQGVPGLKCSTCHQDHNLA